MEKEKPLKYGGKQESRVENTEGRKGDEEKKIDYQMMKSERYQNVNKEGSLNETGKKEKRKYEIPQKQNYTKKEKEKAKKNYIESNLEKKYVALDSEKNETQNWEEKEKEQKYVELRNKREKEYM